jgi:protein required for attachment to host cells
MQTTWILVSDASRARLFRRERQGRAWQLLFEIEHPESRAKGRDLKSDRPGRFSLDHAKGFQLQMEPVSPHEIEAERFAGTLVELLERGLDEHAFDRLMLVAPPHFLGLLRKRLGKEVSRRVTGWRDKDYTHLAPRELERRLAEPI